MPLHNRPLVPIAIAYICGIIFARYLYIPWRLCILGVLVPYKKLRFYLSILVFGYLFYQLSLRGVGWNDWSIRTDFLKEHIRRIIYYNIPNSQERNLLAGLFLGERYRISSEIIDVLRNTNTMHILAISGLHIGFIGIMLVGVFRLMFIPRKFSVLLAILGVLVYVSIVGWRPPAFRSVVMFSVFVMGWVIDRPSDVINNLALSAIIILLITPMALFQVGFQLSFIIALGLSVAVPLVKGGYLKKALWSSVVAWISSLPLVAYYFKVISPISILANLIIVPGISIVIALGFISIALGSIYIGISGVFNITNYFLINGLLRILTVISKILLGYFYIQDFPIYFVFIAYIVIGIVFFSLLKNSTLVVE